MKRKFLKIPHRRRGCSAVLPSSLLVEGENEATMGSQMVVVVGTWHWDISQNGNDPFCPKRGIDAQKRGSYPSAGIAEGRDISHIPDIPK